MTAVSTCMQKEDIHTESKDKEAEERKRESIKEPDDYEVDLFADFFLFGLSQQPDPFQKKKRKQGKRAVTGQLSLF